MRQRKHKSKRFLVCSLLLLPGIAWADGEPFQPTVTPQEFGQQCAVGIGRYHVELQMVLLKEAKYQAEIERLRKLVPPQETEKK